jgi:dCMP deaminase
MRPGWDEYFGGIARMVATRATCTRIAVGAVIEIRHQLISTGYNGAPRGIAHCTDVGCAVVDGHCVRCLHAEDNAIAVASDRIAIPRSRDITLHTTHLPCLRCTQRLLQTGIGRVVWQEDYVDARTEALGYGDQAELLVDVGIEVVALGRAAPDLRSPPSTLHPDFR